jgi:dTDP-4-amino-4,6-dideoxygalactose transaminase
MEIPLASPNIGKEEAQAAYDVVKSGWLNEGKKVECFENNFADFIGTKHAIAFFNGTVALHSVLAALKLKQGDEVIVPSFTFISTANSVIFTGAKPVFADIDEYTFNMSPDDVNEKISNRTRAIIPVHYGGQAADMKQLCEIADDNNLLMIEDAAEAHGATYHDRKVGTFGNAGMFSFTPTKNITTGEGGIITTNDKKLSGNLRLLKNHGQSSPYHHIILGYNYRMTEMQAAIGIEQLKKLNLIIDLKQKNQEYLTKKLSSVNGLTPPFVPADRKHVYMLYTIKIDEKESGISRDAFMQKLEKKGIMTKIYFPPVHMQPYYKDIGYSNQKLPVTEKIFNSVCSLPCHSKLTKKELDFIVTTIKGIIY